MKSTKNLLTAVNKAPIGEQEAFDKLSKSDQEIVKQVTFSRNGEQAPAYAIKDPETGCLGAPNVTGDVAIDSNLFAGKLAQIYGTPSPAVSQHLTGELTSFIQQTDADLEPATNAALALIAQIKPKDAVEALLVNQMIAVHTLSMQSAKLALLKDQTLAGVTLYLREVNKLSRTFAAQMAALDKHRGKGQQKMTVEHVHVHKGGQAVIGTVEANAKISELEVGAEGVVSEKTK